VGLYAAGNHNCLSARVHGGPGAGEGQGQGKRTGRKRGHEQGGACVARLYARVGRFLLQLGGPHRNARHHPRRRHFSPPASCLEVAHAVLQYKCPARGHCCAGIAAVAQACLHRHQVSISCQQVSTLQSRRGGAGGRLRAVRSRWQVARSRWQGAGGRWQVAGGKQ